MRYSEFISISEALASDLGATKSPRAANKDSAAVARLKQLNRERLQLIAILVDRELRRYLSSAEYERHQLEKRLGR